MTRTAATVAAAAAAAARAASYIVHIVHHIHIHTHISTPPTLLVQGVARRRQLRRKTVNKACLSV